MNAPLQLTGSARIYAELKARLMQDEGLAEDDQALTDTLEGATDLHEQIAAVAREAQAAKAMASGIDGLLDAMTARKARLLTRADRYRKHIAWAMQEAGLPKLPLPDMTLTMSKGKPELLLDGDPANAPDHFVRVRCEWNKTAVRQALEAGETFPFASLGNAADVLTIKSK